MKYNKLGNTDIVLSEFGFGCASAWGKRFYKETDAMNLFFDAYDQGITYYDTGHSYGLAEERLGKCISELGTDKRKELVISTKCGTRVDGKGNYYKDWSVDWLKQSIDISLNRLNTDYIDMLNLHSPNLDNLTDDVWYWLEDIKKQKLAKAVGASCLTPQNNKSAVNNNIFDFIMISYNILKQDVEPVIEELHNSGKGVIAGTPLAKTLYSNDIYKVTNVVDAWYLLRALVKNRNYIKKGRDFRFINTIENATGNQIALRYVLENPHITSAVFGTTSKEHLLENIQAADIVFTEELKRKMQSYHHDTKHDK